MRLQRTDCNATNGVFPATSFQTSQPFTHRHARHRHPGRIQLGCLSSGRDGVPDALGVSSTDAGTRRQCTVRRLSKVCKGTACWTPIIVNVQLRNTPAHHMVQQRWLVAECAGTLEGDLPSTNLLRQACTAHLSTHSAVSLLPGALPVSCGHSRGR